MAKYSVEFKLEVVKYYEKNKCGYDTTAKHFNVGFACVQRWVNKYKVHGVKGLIKNQQQYVRISLKKRKRFQIAGS